MAKKLLNRHPPKMIKTILPNGKVKYRYPLGTCPGWDTIVTQLKREVGNRCELCGKSSNKLNVHHKDGVGYGDTTHPNNVPSNLQVLCVKCHRKIHWLEDNLIPFIKGEALILKPFEMDIWQRTVASHQRGAGAVIRTDDARLVKGITRRHSPKSQRTLTGE